jgi:transcriptional regulator with XRE-family HTH domain
MRKRRGFSQEQFAHEAGLDRSYMGGIERGERNLTLVNLQRLADALDVCLANLFKGMECLECNESTAPNED